MNLAPRYEIDTADVHIEIAGPGAARLLPHVLFAIMEQEPAGDVHTAQLLARPLAPALGLPAHGEQHREE